MARCTTPFGPENELIAGPEWTRKFVLACRARGLDEQQQEAILRHATDGRQGAARAVLCADVVAVRATWKRVVEGLTTPPPDGSLIFEITKKKTRTMPAQYKLVGVATRLGAHVALVDKHFPGVEVA
jgi:hypothetical protein